MGDEQIVPAYDGDRQFSFAAHFSKSHHELADTLKSAPVMLVARSFSESIDRCGALCVGPLDLIAWMRESRTVEVLSLLNLNMPVRLHYDAEHQQASPPALRDEYGRVHTHLESMQPMTIEARANGRWSAASAFVRMLIQADLKEREAGNPIPRFAHSVDAILSAMVMSAYAAFETLATDLWSVALDECPEAAKRWMQQNEKKQITFGTLATTDLNLANKFGTLLQRSGKATFQTLLDLRENYKQAFGDEADVCFQPDNALIETERLRHHLAHRGGLIDQRFKTSMKAYPRYGEQPIGSYVVMFGPHVRKHIDACIHVGVHLLKFVDEQISEKKLA